MPYKRMKVSIRTVFSMTRRSDAKALYEGFLVKKNDRCTFMISNRSAVSKLRRLKTPVLRTAEFPMKGDLSHPILCTFRPYLASAGSPRSKAHSASFEV
jgi:hypothetical protein